jgi:MraZ protein
LFLGRTGSSMDEMGRIKLPESFLALLKTSAVVTQGFERNLLVLPVDSFAELVRQIAALSQTDPLVRLLTRILIGNAHEIKIAANGKIQVPEDLRKFSNLEQAVILVGLGDYFEIWSQTGWEVQLNRMQDFEANANRFSVQTLVIRGVA